MADSTQPHTNMETLEETPQSSYGSGGKGSDYVIPSSVDSSLVHVSRDSSLMERKETGLLQGDKMGNGDLGTSMKDEHIINQTGEMEQKQTSYGNESTVTSNGFHSQIKSEGDKDEVMDLSLKSDDAKGSLSFKSGNFSLLSGLSDYPASSGEKDTPSIGSCSNVVSPESFVVLNDSHSEASLTPRSPLYTPQEGPKILYEFPSESRQDLSSTVSSESIVVLDHNGHSNTVTSQSSESPESHVPDIEKEEEEFSLPLKYFEKSFEISNESPSKEEALTMDDDDDIDLVCETGFDSLLAERNSSEQDGAVDGTNNRDLHCQIDCINAKKLEAMLESQHDSKTEEFSLIDNTSSQGTEDLREAEEKLILQMPDVDSNDVFDLTEDSTSPIKIYQPAVVLTSGKDGTGDERLSSFFPLDKVSEDDPMNQNHQDEPVLGKEAQSDELLVETQGHSKEVISEESKPHEHSLQSYEKSFENSMEDPQIFQEEKDDFSKSESSKVGTDFSMLDSEAVIPGVTDSLVVHISEFSDKAASEFTQGGASSARTSNDEFSLLDIGNDGSQLDLQNIDSDPQVSNAPVVGNFENLAEAKEDECEMKTEVPDRFSINQNLSSTHKQSILHEKLTTALRHFGAQGLDLQNERDISSMTEQIVGIVSDLFGQTGTEVKCEFAKAETESVCESELFEKISMQSHDDFQQNSRCDYSVVTKHVELSEVKIRLLMMLDGKRIFEENHEVILHIDKSKCSVDISGTTKSVSAAETILESNKWMVDYIVRSLKFNFDAEVTELLQFENARDYVDTELTKAFDFKVCWNTVPQNKMVLIYVKSDDQVQRVEDLIRSLLCSESVTKPVTVNIERWNEALTNTCNTFPGKVLIKIQDQERAVYRVACTKDVSVAVEDMVRKAEMDLQEVSEVWEPKQLVMPMSENDENDIKDSDQILEKAVGDDVPQCIKCLLIEEEAFRFLQKWKRTELEVLAINQNVRIGYIDKDGFGFELIGKEFDIQMVQDYINNMRDETVWKTHKVQSGDLINFLQADNNRVLRDVEERNQCCIDIVQEGDAPVNEENKSYPDFTLDPVTVSTKCGLAYWVEADVVIEAVEDLEITPYGPNRYHYDSQHHRRIVKVAVPRWNPDLGKQKSNFCEILVDLFSFMEKYKITSAAMSVQKFNDWPYGKLVKAILMSLQTLTQKTSDLKLRKIIFCDTDVQTCSQVVNILSEALGQPSLEDSSITLPRAQKRAQIEIFVGKGEIAKEKVDIIVNTTSRTLDLKKGGVSKSILERAGSEMQKQIKRYHPKGLEPGEIAATSSFNLDCKRVYHGALEPWPQKHGSDIEKRKCIDVLEKFVLDCLHQADMSKYRTLAFPALGTGVLEMPPVRVARTMMAIIRRFETNHPHTTLSTVRILIHPKDAVIYRAFMEALSEHRKAKEEDEVRKEAEIVSPEPEEPTSLEDHKVFTSNPCIESIFKKLRVSFSIAGSSLSLIRTEILVNIDSIQLYASLGDPTRQEGYDAIVMMWLDDDGFNSAHHSDQILTSSARSPKQPTDFKLSERRQLVTPAGNLPQRKILHVYVSEANISEAFVRAMILAEQEGDISSLVFPLRFNDPLAKDYTSYTKSLYQAIERYIQMDRRTPSQLMKVKMCISGKHMVNPVLSILEKLDKDHKIIDDHHRRKEITPLILKVTAMREHMSRVLGELDNPPPSVQEPTVIYSRQDSQNIPDDDRTQTIYIRDIYPNVYETFLFFFRTRIQKNSSEVQMEYQSLENRVKITGHVSNVTAWAQDIQKQLLEVKRDMCVDIYDLPQEVKSKKVPVTRIVAELQKSLNLVLLYIPEDCSDSFHIIGLRSTYVESATHKIMDQINLAASRAKQNSTVPMEGNSEQTKALHPIPMDERMNVHLFIMPNGIQVYVYQDSILQLPVDCIVNAANEDLDHGGGVARAISDAAGKSMDKECKNYIKKYGKVKVGTSCHTNAGALNYKYIIHTVGPRWKPKEAVYCRRLLRSAVDSCISIASDLGMQSVGIPAISSGIFGGPLEECVEIYSEATIQTCLSLGPNTSLKEIHFIDKNPSIVAFISSAFAAAVKNKNTSLPASVEILVNQQTANVTSIRPPSDVESLDVKVKVEYPRKKVFRMEGIEIHEYELKKDFKVLVYSNDIINCKTNAIAFGQDLKLNHGGLIANTVKKLGGSDYAKKLKEAKKGKTLHYGEVLTVDAGNTFETICFYLEAITPTFSQTDLSESCCVSDIQKCNYNLLLEACRVGVPSLAMPFLGTGSDLGKTELMAGVLFHQVVKFVSDIGLDCKLKELHIVNKEQGPTLAIRDLFDEYVLSERRKLVEEWGNALGVSTKTPSLSSHIEGSLVRDVNMSAPMMNGTASEWRSSNQGKFASSEELEEDMEVDGEVGEEEEGTTETIVEIHSPPKRIPSAPSEDEFCAICLDNVDNDDCKVLEKCSHVFCRECIERQFKSYKPVCPTCGTVYGIITGNQPEGKMTVQHKQELHLPGYEQYGTYIVTYDFEDGIQGDDHPNPTVEYEGTMRSGYLPDCPKGELVLQLFKLAFNRKLMFTVGHSRTTGMDNVVTWNDIHHKTSVTGGPQRFGYPDPHYLDRVLEELAAKGVREQDLLDNTE